tara:strand:+ start:837 stop:1025 length:189 start_codon:yes stop_codon:yes gene_type:complete
METKNRSDSVDSRSYSFDSTDSKYKIIIKKRITPKRRKREQTVDDIAKSPKPDITLYFSQYE